MELQIKLLPFIFEKHLIVVKTKTNEQDSENLRKKEGKLDGIAGMKKNKIPEEQIELNGKNI